jgi:tetratricopeptide (TPR) repeat protein
MRKIGIAVIALTMSLICLSSCGKKMISSTSVEKRERNYDTSAFDYIYVEAVKQKLMGNAGDALKYFEQCIKIFPESDASYYQMAQLVVGMGDIKNGKKYAAKALSLKEKNIWYLTMMAGIYYK